MTQREEDQAWCLYTGVKIILTQVSRENIKKNRQREIKKTAFTQETPLG